MTQRFELYLSRKADATWPGATVWEIDGRFILRRPWMEEIILSDEKTPERLRFRTARDALAILRKTR